jgi:D-alanyl-D-alanine carboxypeptidase/D-alanyl-D-alanine-endopeptidase (penicillin-binding protein 4)
MRLMRLVPLVLAAAAAASPAGAPDALAGPLLAALRDCGVAPEHSAFLVAPLDDGPLRLSFNAQAALNPASTMKLVTTFVALHALGPAYQWRTEVLAEQEPRAGVLDGALWLRGSGDPTLVIERFWLLVQHLRALGLRELRGDLVLDRSAYDPALAGGGTLDGNELRPYNVAPDALLVNYKAVTFDLVPDAVEHVARIVPSPALAGMQPPPPVALVDGPCGDWRERLQGDFSQPWAPAMRGVYPASCGAQAWSVSLLTPTEYLGAAFRALWQSSGGSWSGAVRDGVAPSGARSVAVFESPPLSEVIREINKFSNNVMARQLFLTIGAPQAQTVARQASAASPPSGTSPAGPASAVSPSSPASLERSARAVHAWLDGHGLPMPELVLDNGAGLSRIERISAASMARLLARAWRDPLMPELVASLPLSGVDGTMKARATAVGAAHVKTGLLADARAIAGYVRAASGRIYVVVGIINDPNAPAAQQVHDALLQLVYERG